MTNSGIILCGGLSSRMGRAKALLPWRGRSMLAHVASVLRRAVDELIVVTSAELDLETAGLEEFEPRIVIDREPRLGPLGGIREGLEAMRGDVGFFTGTDAPYLTEGFVRGLIAFEGAAALEIDGFVQPISATYPKSGLPLAEKLLKENRGRPLFLLQELGFRAVSPQEVPDAESIRGFNDPAGYLEAVAQDDARVEIELLGIARARTGRESVDASSGVLRDVLATVPEVELVRDGDVAANFLVSLNGIQFLRDGGVPIGPGDRLIVMDAAVGG